MSSPLSRPERVAVARLHALLELLPTALDKRMAPLGITSFEFTLLEKLSEAPEHRLRLSKLASQTNATLPRLSRVASGLERRGLIERRPCPSDGRATNALLTERGAELYAEGRPMYDAGVRELILQGLDEHDVAELARLSYAVLTHLDPDHRLAVTSPESAGDDDRDGSNDCAADPAPDQAPCAADPAPTKSDTEADAEETIIFGADWCGDCRRAKLIFDRAGAPYRYIDLVRDPAAAGVAQDISGRTNIPVILYPDRSHQVEPSNAAMLQKISELRLGPGLVGGRA